MNVAPCHSSTVPDSVSPAAKTRSSTTSGGEALTSASHGPLEDNRHELEADGWSVRLLEGLDHTQAMQPDNVLPVIRPWLAAELVRPG